jgi:hypothetical protein
MNKWTAALAGLSMAIAVTANAGDHDHSSRGGGIEGVWLQQVTLRDCATGAAMFDPFPAINTFHVGGTMSEHGSRMPPSIRNSGQGVWKQVGRNRFTSRFIFQRFDLNGFYIGTQEVTRKMALSNDGVTLESTARTKIVDAGGVLINQGCATEVARRF